MSALLAVGILAAWCAARVAIRSHTGIGIYDGWKLLLAPLDVALAFAAADAVGEFSAMRCVAVVAIGLAVPWRPAGRIPPSAVVLPAVLVAGFVREEPWPLALASWGIARAHVWRMALLADERDAALARAERLEAARLARSRCVRGEEPTSPDAALDLPALLRASRVRAGERLALEPSITPRHARDLELIVYAAPGAPREVPHVDRTALADACDHVFRRALELSSGERLLKALVGADAGRTRVRFIHDLASAPVADEAVLAELAAWAGDGEGPLGVLVARHGAKVETGFQNPETREVFVELVFGA